MNSMEFKIKSYSKTELARVYNPQLCDRTAQYTFLKWIDKNVKLMQELISTGYSRTDRFFTPKQVEIIVEHLGEP